MALKMQRRYRKILCLLLIVLLSSLLCPLFKQYIGFEIVRIERTQDQHKRPLCTPINYVLFAKLHKTGSSTLTNIFNRYGDERDLNILLPNNPKNKSVYHFYWPHKFRIRLSTSLYNREANILCNHARYNSKPMQWLFPKERSRYITMLREPSTHFESVFNFMGFAKYFGLQNRSNPLETFLGSPHTFLVKPLKSVQFLLKNPMMFDLGFPETSYDNSTMVQAYIERLAAEFDLVMIMEYFDESLVLLKRTLCWQTEDILYFKLNERREKDQRPRDLNEKSKLLIGQWNNADSKLYDYFNQTFWAKIEAEGPEFYNDLQTFRDQNKAKEKACLKQGNYLDQAYRGKFVKGYALNQNLTTDMREMCNKMIRNEITYIDYFRKKLRLKLLNII